MNSTLKQKSAFLKVPEAIQWIKEGRTLVLSGEEALLAEMPRGNWIGGTIPYFYFENNKGKMDKDHIFAADFTGLVDDLTVATYDISSLPTVCQNGYANGFNFMILPALRDIHLSFALNVPNFENLYTNPLIGLIAGADLAEFSTGRLSKTFNGHTLEQSTDNAVVMHAQLPTHQVARLEIINVFEPNREIIIEAPQDGFIVKECRLNGQEVNLYQYIKENDIDISYPLMCDYQGALVNVSYQRLDDENQQVIFYAPLFKGKQYTASRPLKSYVDSFSEKAEEVLSHENNICYNCNCILNYLYGGLDQYSIGFSGPTTFGEIAYQLLNQTFTYLAIDERY